MPFVAKLSKEQWGNIRTAFEVRGESSTKLSKEHGIAESTICRRAKKEGWDKEKTQDVINKKVSADKALAEITQGNARNLQAINTEVAERLRLERVFATDAEHNQSGATERLKAMEASREAELAHYDIHSRITAKNKETLLGKTPQTQVNIQNNVGSDADAIVERLMKKHQ